jgi:hypothetical protein
MDEEIKTQRKQWQRPELTVLVRSKPEEAVLTYCKLTGGAQKSGYPTNVASRCCTPKGACSSSCSTPGTS